MAQSLCTNSEEAGTNKAPNSNETDGVKSWRPRKPGLTSSILSGNTYKAFEMASKVLAGIVNVNSPTVNDEIHAPMGGVRDSGWGRTGPRSLDDFSDVIWINSHSGQRQYPF